MDISFALDNTQMVFVIEIIDCDNTTYSLSGNNVNDLPYVNQYIKCNPKIKEIRYNGMRWIRKMPKDKWCNKLEKKLKTLSPIYTNSNILAGAIFWIGCENIPNDSHNSLTLELHTTKSITIDEYRDKCILETIQKVVLNEEFSLK